MVKPGMSQKESRDADYRYRAEKSKQYPPRRYFMFGVATALIVYMVGVSFFPDRMYVDKESGVCIVVVTASTEDSVRVCTEEDLANAENFTIEPLK